MVVHDAGNGDPDDKHMTWEWDSPAPPLTAERVAELFAEAAARAETARSVPQFEFVVSRQSYEWLKERWGGG